MVACRGFALLAGMLLLPGLAISADTVAPNPTGDTAVNKLRVGIIGLDTSHVVAFTTAIRNAKADDPLARLAIVAAYPGGSNDIAVSRDRVAGYTAKLQEWGVEIVPSIDTLVERVDAVLLESVDGRPHLEQVRPVLKAKKPVFIDKPVAGTLADAIEIFRLAEAEGVPCFSSSSLRYSTGVLAARDNPKLDGVVGCMVHAPCSLEATHPDLFWYGIHGVEMIFTIMGPGCVSVQRTHTDDCDVVTGIWKDGRVATFRGIRNAKLDYSGFVYGKKDISMIGSFSGYQPLLVEIARFFETRKPPVAAAETIEIFAFMEAADESKRQGGCPVTLDSVLTKARSAR
jgi:predicted dehydrogenase